MKNAGEALLLRRRLYCLDEPPALGDPLAIELPVAGNVAMAQGFLMRLDVGVEDEVDQAAIVMQQLLHLGIHGRTFRLIGFRARRDQQLVEARILPERVIPRRTRRIGRGEHPVAGRPAAPVGGDEGLLQPDIVPIAIIGGPRDFQVEACRPGAFLPDQG